ncbi:recombinase family protein [Arthrobacter sp. E3]|uniref:recombinase family protein n=1 Tax=Arthrobacter sp. E3 TaxID=517402 RepID=UPI001A94BF85|nr:recombinase family protein [Arthrobacter sp. E3]
MTLLGCARVSTADQDTAMQIRELKAAECERIYRDHGISGTKTSRPELDKMLDGLSQGDEVVVWKLDRLGRNTSHLLELLDDFKARGIKFRSLRDGIAAYPGSDLGGAMAQPMVTIIFAFAPPQDSAHALMVID